MCKRNALLDKKQKIVGVMSNFKIKNFQDQFWHDGITHSNTCCDWLLMKKL